jgi:uncharacterized membrane protein
VTSFIIHQPNQNQNQHQKQSRLYFFDKVFEESGPLGKGITVGKIQVALMQDRSQNSIFSTLQQQTSTGTNSRALARMSNNVCLALLRKSDDWTAACSASQWFSLKDAGKAESLCNDWSNREAAKFEKEYIPTDSSSEGSTTLVVVSLVLELQGDSTTWDGAGFSLSKTRDVLNSVASDCMVDSGECVNAAEVFWTPSEPSEVLSRHDMLLDFPELIDL